MKKIKVLNLYAGLGGNRKLWPNDKIEVTAVELNSDIAKVYQDFFPNDKVIVTDAHQYLLEHYKEFDFIWASPPCPTHSRLNRINYAKFGTIKYPDMTLYQEILLLQQWFKGNWCVENVISYYKPLIQPQELASHYFWSNFIIQKIKNITRGIGFEISIEDRQKKLNLNLDNYNIGNGLKKKILNNCTEPETGLHIFNCAFKYNVYNLSNLI